MFFTLTVTLLCGIREVLQVLTILDVKLHNVIIQTDDINDIHEAISIDILAISTKGKLCMKATSETNMDIVNPIPAIKDTKNTDNQFMQLGFSVIPIKQPR